MSCGEVSMLTTTCQLQSFKQALTIIYIKYIYIWILYKIGTFHIARKSYFWKVYESATFQYVAGYTYYILVVYLIFIFYARNIDFLFTSKYYLAMCEKFHIVKVPLLPYFYWNFLSWLISSNFKRVYLLERSFIMKHDSKLLFIISSIIVDIFPLWIYWLCHPGGTWFIF